MLISAGLAARDQTGTLIITDAGGAFLAREESKRGHSSLDPFLAQHVELVRRCTTEGEEQHEVVANEAESPLVWLAKRKGRDGRPLISPVQLQAGERLRSDFTRAQMMPRVTSNWSADVAQGRRGDTARPETFAEAVVSARQRVRAALEAVGPEFAGLLLDVCCFLKRLEEVEFERGWSARSAKVVLQLGLDRLGRHYGLSAAATGKARAAIQTWLACDLDEGASRSFSAAPHRHQSTEAQTCEREGD